MKKSLFALSLALLGALNNAVAQIWDIRDADFPNAVFSSEPRAANDSVAWVFGFAVDTAGYFTYSDYSFSRTTDGGQTWVNGNFPHSEPGYFGNIAPLGEQVAWLSYEDPANGSKVLKTVDGGQTWEPQNAGITTWVNFVHFFNGTVGVAMGDPDFMGFQIFKTLDGGSIWERISAANVPAMEPGEYGYSAGFEAEGNRIWFYTNHGRVYHSDDLGSTWGVWDDPGLVNIWDIEADEAGNCYVMFNDFSDTITFVPQFSLFRRSALDSAWIDLTPPDNDLVLQSIASIPGTDVLMATFRNSFTLGPFYTRLSYDHGASWQTISTGDKAGYLNFWDADTGYATEMKISTATDPTKIFRYTGSPITGLFERKPLNINLAVSPNPASDFVRIDWSAPVPGDFWVLLNDAQGRLIDHKTINQTAQGNAQFELTNRPAGIYTLTVSSEKGCLTKKFVKQ